MATVSSSQPNGITSSGSTAPSQSQSQPTQSSTTTAPAPSQTTATNAPAAATNGSPTSPATGANNNSGGNNATHAPRPRDARTIELLLTSQGVTSYDPRVPQLLMDFGYRHTSSVLSDALHLAADPYTTQAGSKPSGSSGVAPMAPAAGDASVSVGAVGIAIASRQAYQFRGGSGAGGGGGGGGGSGPGGAGGGGASKDWLLELAKERNRIALPRVLQHEWGVRLPNERFVLSGMGWDLRDSWAEGSDDDDDDDDEEEADAMEGVEIGAKKDADAKKDDGGLDELLGDDMADEDADEDMEGME